MRYSEAMEKPELADTALIGQIRLEEEGFEVESPPEPNSNCDAVPSNYRED